MSRKKILFLYAVDGERISIGERTDHELIFVKTGVGKSLAALHTMKALCEYKPDLAVNFGTAGSVEHSIGDIFVINKFVDRDLLKVNLPSIPCLIEANDRLSFVNSEHIVVNGKDGGEPIHVKQGTCCTGDSFVTDLAGITEDVVDMEAFAEALACREMNVPFVSVKYVSDIIGSNSVKAWAEKLADARVAISRFFENIDFAIVSNLCESE